MRTDNAAEFEAIAKHVACDGIVFEFTEPHTPQQNGIAERRNRTLFTRIRALLRNALLPKRFWPCAARTASYIINRSPSAKSKKTPEELWTGIRPDIAHLRVFGCLAYATIPNPFSQLEDRSIPCIFLEHTRSTQQFKLLDENGRLRRASSVIFDESTAGSTKICVPGSVGAFDENPDDIDFYGDHSSVVLNLAQPMSSTPAPDATVATNEPEQQRKRVRPTAGLVPLRRSTRHRRPTVHFEGGLAAK
jgi:hypothetical protein